MKESRYIERIICYSYLSESVVEEEVDEEVDGRVGDHQHITDAREVELEPTTASM